MLPESTKEITDETDIARPVEQLGYGKVDGRDQMPTQDRAQNHTQTLAQAPNQAPTQTSTKIQAPTKSQNTNNVTNMNGEEIIRGSNTKVIREPVRSGQQYYAKGGDLIVLSPVSHGAELLADGNIHVYGPLRGRALAGVTGDTSAHIFCQSLEAELISIAGNYKISEDMDQAVWRLAVDIYFEDGRLHIQPL